MRVEYSANNSGGSWWLSDENWKDLEKAGWKVEWNGPQDPGAEYPYFSGAGAGKNAEEAENHRRLGALAKRASLECETPTDALKNFEKVTGMNVSDEGCNCCGPPHSFNWKDSEGNYEYCSGTDCLEYLFPGRKIPGSIREAIENNREQ